MTYQLIQDTEKEINNEPDQIVANDTETILFPQVDQMNSIVELEKPVLTDLDEVHSTGQNTSSLNQGLQSWLFGNLNESEHPNNSLEKSLK